MEAEEMLTISQFCMHYNAEITFVRSLHEAGLINITTINNETYVDYDQLGELEKFIRLHHELEINTEGIEAIAHLLKKMESMQQEIIRLKDQLSIYEQ